MRILHIIDDLTMGGGQNLLVGLTAEQVKRGNDVTVLQLKRSRDLTVTNKIVRHGVKVAWITEAASLYNPVLVFKLIPWLRNAEIVHVHLFPALYWTGFAKLISLSRTPLIYTEHSTKNRRRTHPILRRVDNFVYKHCYSKVIACADKALETFLKVYPNVGHVSAINNGVDTMSLRKAKPYSKKDLLGIPEDSFVVTMVARFMFMKRQDTIVEAISKLPKDYHACFVGSEPTDEELIKVQNLAEKLKVSDRVHFLFIRSDVPCILKTSDVVVMSSEHEGLSLSCIEGMAAGKPFVATDVDGLREIVKGAGELFKLYDSEELAHILIKLKNDHEYYNELATRCLQRAALYGIQPMVDNYMNVYLELLRK